MSSLWVCCKLEVKTTQGVKLNNRPYISYVLRNSQAYIHLKEHPSDFTVSTVTTHSIVKAVNLERIKT